MNFSLTRMSKFLSFIKTIFQTKKPLAVNDSPLFFTEQALFKIKEHLDSRPAGIKSAFKINLLYQKEKIICQVGFDDYKLIRKTLFEYPVPIIISEEDELFLRGSYIDYHLEEGVYYHYPNINIEVTSRSKNSILVFYLDRNVISVNSEIKNIALDKTTFSQTQPILIRNIFQTGFVESIFIEGNLISVEKNSSNENAIEIEERLTDIILTYFETCGYPLYVTNTKIEARKR